MCTQHTREAARTYRDRSTNDNIISYFAAIRKRKPQCHRGKVFIQVVAGKCPSSKDTRARTLHESTWRKDSSFPFHLFSLNFAHELETPFSVGSNYVSLRWLNSRPKLLWSMLKKNCKSTTDFSPEWRKLSNSQLAERSMDSPSIIHSINNAYSCPWQFDRSHGTSLQKSPPGLYRDDCRIATASTRLLFRVRLSVIKAVLELLHLLLFAETRRIVPFQRKRGG